MARRYLHGRIATWVITLMALLLLTAGTIGATPSGAHTKTSSVSAPATLDQYFHGKADDQADKATYTGDPSSDGHLTWSPTAPSGTAPVVQTTTAVANADYVGNPLAAFWTGHLGNATYDNNLDIEWYWSTENAAATASGADVEVSVFADPNWNDNSGTLIGRTTVSLGQVLPTPTLESSLVPIKGSVTSGQIVIQVTPVFIDTGQDLKVYYDSTSTPSGFAVTAPGTGGPPPPTVDFSTGLAFAPATIVSAHFLGAEPQTTIERRPPNSSSPAINPKRIFIDWPLSSRTQIGQLSRSVDGGSSFRLLFDPTCAPRSRPTCQTGGGGDTENDVNLYDGNLFFADQEVLANEAVASSTDHGDTFPAARQFAITNAITAVDRQWIAATDGKSIHTTAPDQTVDAFLSYHIPLAGEYIQGIDKATGLPIPQPAPQLTGVSQSGQSAVDNSDGPGHGWIYQPFRDGGGYEVGTANGNNYQDPTAWQVNNVSDDQPNIFPWLGLDDGGNAYAVWATDGVVYYSFSPINDLRNDPAAGGRPGTYWSPKVRVSPAGVLSAVFPEVTGGSQGRVAITFDGTRAPLPCAAGQTSGCGPGATYLSDKAPVSAKWSTYGVVLTNAMGAGGDPIHATTGLVSHRFIHEGSICTSGTTCTGDRSLLDMIDVKSDQIGRTGVVFTNNYSDYQNHGNADDGPFVNYSEQTAGPSLQAFNPAVKVTPPSEPLGDATWPNRSGSPDLASLDLRSGTQLYLSNGSLIAKIPLKSSAKSRMASDLAAYNATGSNVPPADRLQYLVRFETADKILHIDYEYNADGSTDAFGGKLNDNDRITNGTTTLATGYHHDSGYQVSATVNNQTNTLILKAPASNYGLTVGSNLYSVASFALAGPNDANESLITNVSRTVDASPPFDKRL